MLRGWTVALAIGMLAGVTTAHSLAVKTSSCTVELALSGVCGSTDGSSLTITGTQQQVGLPPSTGPRRGGGDPNDSSVAPTVPSGPSQEALEFAECMNDAGTTRCARRTAPDAPGPVTPDPTSPGTPTITITDLARFAPPPVLAATEPGNIGIADMPANFVATATAETQDGVLFGIPFQVRFIPETYEYTYGDGTAATVTSPGRTWADLGQAQFTPTPTSHVYREPGTYLADVDVRYSAEVDLGGGWQPIAGRVTTDGPAQEIRIYEARTALVARTCDEDPDGPGC